jgi:hypothetical protein
MKKSYFSRYSRQHRYNSLRNIKSVCAVDLDQLFIGHFKLGQSHYHFYNVIMFFRNLIKLDVVGYQSTIGTGATYIP